MTQINVKGYDRVGFVNDITKSILSCGNIQNINFNVECGFSEGHVVLDDISEEALETLVNKLKSIKGVIHVQSILK